MINNYKDHNREVREYFKGSDRLLIINLKNKNDYKRFCNFIGVDSEKESFFWKNKTEEIEIRK